MPFTADTLVYRLRQVDLDGTATYSTVVEVALAAPETFALKAAEVRLEVYDVLGRRVRVLVGERQAADRYAVRFEASRLAAGVYFVQLTASDAVATRRVVVVR